MRKTVYRIRDDAADAEAALADRGCEAAWEARGECLVAFLAISVFRLGAVDGGHGGPNTKLWGTLAY